MARRRCAAVDRLLEQLRSNGQLEIRPVPRHGRRPGENRHNPYEAGVKRYEMTGMGIYRDDNLNEPRPDPPKKRTKYPKYRKSATRRYNRSDMNPTEESVLSEDCNDLGLTLPDLGVETDLDFNGTVEETSPSKSTSSAEGGYGSQYVCSLDFGFVNEEVTM